MGTRATAAGARESNQLGAQAAAVSAEHFTPEALATPFRKVMKHLGYADVYDSSSVGEAMQWISKRIESGSQSLSRETKGVVQPEDVQALETAAMLYFGVRGTSAALRSASHSRENVRWDKAAKTSDAQKFQDLVKPLDEQQAAAHPAAEVAKTTEAAFDHSKDFKDWLKVDEPAAPKAASSGIAVEEGYRPKTTSGPGAFQIGTSEAEKPCVRPDTPDPYEGLPGGTAPQGWTGVVSKETLLREAGDPTADLHPKADKSLATDTIEGDPKERGSIDLKLLTRMALLGTGAVAGAYLDKDNPVIGAIIGGIGGAIATRAGRAALDRWKASPAEGRAATWLSNKLYTLTKQSQVRQLQALAFLQKVVPPDYKFHAESIYHSMEDSKVKLSARARELKDALVRPLQSANAKLRSSLEALGVNVGPAIEQDYVHRIVKGQRSSVFEELEKSYPSGRNLPKTAPSLKEREAYAIETPTGNREVITMEPGNKFFVHRNGKIVGRGSMKGGEIKWGGQDWRRVQATTGEIETHTNLRYYKDAVGTELDNNIRLSAALRNAEFLNKLKSMPSFSDVAVNVKDTHAPADWRTVDIDQLKGYKFAPRVASALDDFKGEMAKHPAEALGKISRILTGSMFWNPLPHIWNVLDHAIVQRGLSAWVSPQGYTRLWKTVGPAWKAVVTQDSNYLKFMHEGAGLMYPNVILRDFSEKVMQQLGQAPDMGPVARAFGYANPAEMVRRIYALSRKTLWAGNDVIMMQAYFEKQLQGASVQGAIRQVEKHIPNYRIPDRVLGSRTISQVLQSPFFTAFGRYDYGRLASYGAMIKDAVGKNSSVGARAKALDQMSMLAVMGLVVYPIVLDKVAQAITGIRRLRLADTVHQLFLTYCMSTSTNDRT